MGAAVVLFNFVSILKLKLILSLLNYKILWRTRRQCCITIQYKISVAIMSLWFASIHIIKLCRSYDSLYCRRAYCQYYDWSWIYFQSLTLVKRNLYMDACRPECYKCYLNKIKVMSLCHKDFLNLIIKFNLHLKSSVLDLEASESKWVNPDDIWYEVNSLKLRGLHLQSKRVLVC